MTTRSMSMSEKEFKENKLNSTNDNFVKKRKDPKTMSVEELEEYINKNKFKFTDDRSYNPNNTNNNMNNKSLNSSFNSQRNLNLSFTNNLEQNKTVNFNKINDNVKKSENDTKLNSSNSEALTKNYGLNYNYLGNNNMVNSNPFINHNNTMNNSNMSLDPMSDGEEKYLKFKSKVFPPNTSSNSAMNTQSNAANNYLKSLQDKNHSLLLENEELKKNFIEVSELLEKERNDFQKKLLNEINKANEVEKSLKMDINSFDSENKELANQVNELKIKLSLYNTNMTILENEKGRHLEQNAFDKEKLQGEIEQLIQESEDNKSRFIAANNENNLLREKLAKVYI
jgi:hypothetical protein